MDFDQEKTQGPPTDDWRLNQAIDQGRAAGQLGYAGDQCARPMSEKEILTELFTYHPPTPVTLPKFAAINQAAKNFAEVILQNCPRGHDRVTAIAQIRAARMLANAAIALNGLHLHA